MKKIIALSCFTALLLAGCGTESEEGFSAPEKTTEPAASTENVTGTETYSEETSADATEASDTETDQAGGIKDMYPAMYQNEVSRVWNEIAAENEGMASIEYALRDLDNNGVPELLLKHGTCEADFMISVYTVSEDGELAAIAELGGSHTVFSHDTQSDAFVLTSGHMGAGAFRWFEMKDGVLNETNSVSFELGKDDKFEDKMAENNVEYIEYVSAYNLGDGETTSYLYHSADDSEEFSGLYLDNIK